MVFLGLFLASGASQKPVFDGFLAPKPNFVNFSASEKKPHSCPDFFEPPQPSTASLPARGRGRDSLSSNGLEPIFRFFEGFFDVPGAGGARSRSKGPAYPNFFDIPALWGVFSVPSLYSGEREDLARLG